jgi:DnaK suppressor protein
MDDLDRAKDLELSHRKAALTHQQEQAAQDNDTNPLIIDGVRVCVDCREPIPEERLKARPEAERCIDCKTTKEKEKK